MTTLEDKLQLLDLLEENSEEPNDKLLFKSYSHGLLHHVNLQNRDEEISPWFSKKSGFKPSKLLKIVLETDTPDMNSGKYQNIESEKSLLKRISIKEGEIINSNVQYKQNERSENQKSPVPSRPMPSDKKERDHSKNSQSISGNMERTMADSQNDKIISKSFGRKIYVPKDRNNDQFYLKDVNNFTPEVIEKNSKTHNEIQSSSHALTKTLTTFDFSDIKTNSKPNSRRISSALPSHRPSISRSTKSRTSLQNPKDPPKENLAIMIDCRRNTPVNPEFKVLRPSKSEVTFNSKKCLSVSVPRKKKSISDNSKLDENQGRGSTRRESLDPSKSINGTFLTRENFASKRGRSFSNLLKPEHRNYVYPVTGAYTTSKASNKGNGNLFLLSNKSLVIKEWLSKFLSQRKSQNEPDRTNTEIAPISNIMASFHNRKNSTIKLSNLVFAEPSDCQSTPIQALTDLNTQRSIITSSSTFLRPATQFNITRPTNINLKQRKLRRSNIGSNPDSTQAKDRDF